MKKIQSKLHRIATCNVCKISLSCFDDKRYILVDDINSLAYFTKIEEVSSIYIEGAMTKIFLVAYQEGGKRTKREQKGVERIYALSIGTPF